MFFKKFKLFKSKKVKQIDDNDLKIQDISSSISEAFEKQKISTNQLSRHELKSLKKDDYRNKKIREICIDIVEANNQIEQEIEEFKIVTDRLSDVEKIRNANIERKTKIVELYDKINQIEEEKVKYEKSSETLEIDTNHYLMLEKNENIMINEIKKLESYEQEYLTIRSDLHKLEGERGNINFEKKKLDSQKGLLKYYVRLLIVVSIIMFFVFVILALNGKLNSYVPVLIAVGAIAANTVYVIDAIRRNAYKLEANRLKENKLIGLFNKVKIRYVNSVKLVEYIHRKYDIRNCKELKLLWERYLKEKDRKFRYEQIIELESVQHETLESELDKLELNDVLTWKKDIKVFLDDTYLSDYEVKLIDNKSELKRCIESNKTMVTRGMQAIRNIIDSNEDYKDEIAEIMKECQLFM